MVLVSLRRLSSIKKSNCPIMYPIMHLSFVCCVSLVYCPMSMTDKLCAGLERLTARAGYLLSACSWRLHPEQRILTLPQTVWARTRQRKASSYASLLKRVNKAGGSETGLAGPVSGAALLGSGARDTRAILRHSSSCALQVGGGLRSPSRAF
jgi:hypothetical protein